MRRSPKQRAHITDMKERWNRQWTRRVKCHCGAEPYARDLLEHVRKIHGGDLERHRPGTTGRLPETRWPRHPVMLKERG
jgi:undecaprenyl pyrophosphate synthase